MQERITRSFSNEGITFTVYGDDEADERIIPIDCVPRILSGVEWRRLESGLTQRIGALNRFLEDVYGEARIVADGVIPTDVVRGCAQYRIEMRGVSVPHGTWVAVLRHRSGADPRRLPGARGQPAGAVGRVLHDRQPQGGEEEPAPPLPELPGAGGGTLRDRVARDVAGPRPRRTLRPLHRPADPGSLQLRVLRACVPGQRDRRGARGGPRPAGQRRLRLHAHHRGPPARGRDLPPGEDDDFLDPLVFRPDSLLGVPGLLHAFKLGRVALANAPGTGVPTTRASMPTSRT